MRRSLVLSSLVALAGCATLGQLAAGAFQKPTVAFKSVSLSDVTLTGATVNVVTTVTNPNAVGLSLARADYKVSVEGHAVAAGAPPKGLSIPAHGSADVTLPAAVRFADLGQAVTTLLAKDHASYRAEGTLGLDTPVGVVSVPVSHEGAFDLPKIPGVQLGAPRLVKTSLQGATLELPLTLTNRGGYALPLDGLVAGVSIAGAKVGNVSAQGLGTLAPGDTRAVTLPLDVTFAGAAQAATALLRGGDVAVGLDGQLQSGPVPVPFGVHGVVPIRR